MNEQQTPRPGDEQWTAYALGELPADAAAVLAEVEGTSDELRREVAETRELAALLTGALARDASTVVVPGLSEIVPSPEEGLASPQDSTAQKGGLRFVKEDGGEAPDVVMTVPWFRGWLPWAVAAALVVLAIGVVRILPSGGDGARPMELAKASSTGEPGSVGPGPGADQAPAPRAGAGTPTLEGSGLGGSREGGTVAPVAPGIAVRAGEADAVVPVVPIEFPPAPVAPLMEPRLMSRYGLGAPERGVGGPRAVAGGGRIGGAGAGERGRVTESVRADPGASRVGALALGLRGGLDGAGAGGGPGGAALAAGADRGTAEWRDGSRGIRELRSLSDDPGSPDSVGIRSGGNPGYRDLGETEFVSPLQQPLSTFGLDVDTGSYANVRRFLRSGVFPPRAAVRVEEMINYFPYRYGVPSGDEVFGVRVEVATCPWEPRHRLVRVGLKARGLEGERPPGNLVFLVDVSGSMQPGDRLPLLKQGLRALVKRLSAADRVAIVTYSSRAGVRLGSTSCEEKDRILEAIDSLEAGGATHGEGGIRQAYEVARQHLIPGGVNRVLLCTDGDFNVGMSDQGQLVQLIAEEARSGVFLTTLGVGTDNFKDALMQQLADRGNGSYHYLDSTEEAQRVLIEQMETTFVTVARDAKAQVEFNPARVAAWRLIGYEKRLMAAAEFNDDGRDAGEVGAGQTVTVLYEIVPAGERVPGGADSLKYQPLREPSSDARSVRRDVLPRELLTLKLRYQRPEGSRSVLKEVVVSDREEPMSADFRFAAAVAAFGMALRDPSWDGGRGFDRALELALPALGEDPGGWRAEFLTLVRKARGMPRR